MLGKQYEARKTKSKFHGNQHKVGEYQNGTHHKGKTAQIVADEHGVGYGTVVRAEKFAQGVDAIASVDPEAKQAILSGKSGMT